jgi:Predicted nucleic acid-binding protein, contains PIN domain
MQIEYIDQQHRFFSDVVSLGKKHSSTLGFMPEGGFIEHAEKRCIIVAHNGSELAGYLMFRLVSKRYRISIVHLCVKESFRGQNIATCLLNMLRGKHEAKYNGISLSCRSDYTHATNVWHRYGFVCKYKKRSRSIDENYLNIWWYDFNKPDLFSVAHQASVKIKVLLDANIIIKLRDGHEEYEPSQDPRALLADWLADEIDYYYAPEVLNEISRDKNNERANKTRAFLGNFMEAKFNIEECKIVVEELEKYIHGTTVNDRSDRIQLASAIASETSYFITLDAGMLEKRSAVEKYFDIQILSPQELILEIDELLNKEEYSPTRLAGVTFHTIAKVSKTELDSYIDIFLSKSNSERKSSFQNIVYAETTNIQNSEVKIIKAGNKPIAFLGYRCDENVLIVSFFRLAETEKKHTLFMQLISDIINKSTNNNLSKIQINEIFLSENQQGILVRMGFEENSGIWTKMVVNRMINSSDFTEIDARFNGHPLINRLNVVEEDEKQQLLIDIERKLFPLKFLDLNIPCYIIPIKPYWAGQLFDQYISGSTLFGADEKRIWNFENVYYRSTRPITEIVPARILWYASTDKKSTRSQAIVASSYLDEVITGMPKVLYQQNKHYGIYEWKHIFDLCNKDINIPIRALRFSGAEVFQRPVKLSSIRDIFLANGKPANTFASPVKIDFQIFNQIYQIGIRENR